MRCFKRNAPVHSELVEKRPITEKLRARMICFKKNPPKEAEETKEIDSLASTLEVLEKHDQNEFIYPPMPIMGNPVNFDLLVDRNRKVKKAMEATIVVVTRDCADSIAQAKAIPVSKEVERIMIAPQVLERMAEVKTGSAIKHMNKTHTVEIQRALVFRRQALEMMNSNYSKQLVRKIEPIYIHESRSLVTPANPA